MALWTQIANNFVDLRKLGPRVLFRHIARLQGRKAVAVAVRGVGPIYIRPGGSDTATLRQVFAFGDYDVRFNPVVFGRLKCRYDAILAAGRIPVIVDAGANIGAATLWFRMLWPSACIVSIEPERENALILHKNVDNRENVIVLEAAVGARPGAVTIASGTTGWGAQTVRSETGIPVITIAEAVANVQESQLFIVKVDIEGFEDELFEENTDWIGDAAMVIIEPHDWMFPGRHTSRSFQRAMAAHPFELFLSRENLLYVRMDDETALPAAATDRLSVCMAE